MLHLLDGFFAAKAVYGDADLGGPAAGLPERRFAEEWTAGRLILRAHVVAEAEGDRQDAVALFVVDLVEGEVGDGALPEFIHGADAVAKRDDEHVGHWTNPRPLPYKGRGVWNRYFLLGDFLVARPGLDSS